MNYNILDKGNLCNNVNIWSGVKRAEFLVVSKCVKQVKVVSGKGWFIHTERVKIKI